MGRLSRFCVSVARHGPGCSYDRFAQDVLAPLLNVAQLRKHGVTLHLLLDKRREPVRDVAAVYLTEPTSDNITRISEDVALGLYDVYHLNFTTSIPRPLLEQLARETVEKQCVQSIASVYDQYCHYVALEPQLFSLNLSNSFSLLNTRNTPSVQLDAFVRTVVDGLFSVCVTLVRSCHAHTLRCELVH